MTVERTGSAPVPTCEDWARLSSPAHGASFTGLVESAAWTVRKAVDDATEAIADLSSYRAVFAPRVSRLGFAPSASEEPVLAARSLVAMWLSAYSLGAVDVGDSFRSAEQRFVGANGASLPRLARRGARPGFAKLPPPAALFALLPYVLDPLAPGTRRSVLRRPDELGDRGRRKARGVYYTPGDVAAHMVRASGAPAWRSCADPACGTGVFLRAALLERGIPLGRLFGIDKDVFAPDACAFVLAVAAFTRSRRWPSVWSAWQTSRSGLATLDSLGLVPGVGLDRASQERREREFRAVRRALEAGETPPVADEQAPLTALGSLFPPLRDGVDLVVSNPPYTKLGLGPTFDPASSRFASLGSSGARRTSRVEALFVELAWQLLSEEGGMSLVLPLSVATSRKPEFVRLRGAMQRLGGEWDMSFFDRAPDALFGDDVKTRNAILTFRRGPRRSIRTTTLLRWTSRTRQTFLRSIEPCPIDCDIGPFVPKVGSAAESALLARLCGLPSCLGAATSLIATARPRLREATFDDAVYVGPTAYNWLGCSRDLAAFVERGHSSESDLTALIFPNADLADAALAVIASRVTFWLWRVQGDGFHVTRTFLRDLPFGLHRLPHRDLGELAAAGRALWSAMREAPIVSVNKRRQTVSFSSLAAGDLLDVADRQLARAFQLEAVVSSCSIRDWHENLVVVDIERRDPEPPLERGQTVAA